MGCVYAISGCFVLLVIGTVWIRICTRRIAATRPSETFDTFLASFSQEVAPPMVLQAVYATFQEWCSDTVPAFPVRADDDIGHIYGMVDEDLDDAVLEVLAACGRVLPPTEQIRRLKPVVTVRDFVGFVAGCPSTPNRSDGQST